MKSLWKVTSNSINDQTMYGVYRLKDINAVDHSGNREFAGRYVPDRSIAEFVANQLNEDQKESPREAD